VTGVRGLAGLAGALLVAGLPLTSCSEVEEAESSAFEPARLEPVAGTDVQRVHLTVEGAERVGIRTVAVERRGRGRKAVSYDALIYDAHGGTWVYSVSGPRSFTRVEVEVARVDGDTAVLADGPPVGARVVTVGATEVFGTEFEVGH
jgi:hypothetical protein